MPDEKQGAKRRVLLNGEPEGENDQEDGNVVSPALSTLEETEEVGWARKGFVCMSFLAQLQTLSFFVALF